MQPLDSSKERYRAFREPQSPGGDAGSNAPEQRRDHLHKRKHYLRQYVHWLWPHKGRILVVLLLALISAGLFMLLPLVTRYIIDDILPPSTLTAHEKLTRLVTVCGAMLLLLLVAQAIETSRAYLMSLLNAKVIFRLRQKLFERFLRLPLGELQDLKSGGIVSRLSQDTDKVTGMVQMAVITPGVATIRVVLTLAVLIFISWRLALIAAAMIPPIVLINLLWIRKVRPIYRAMAEARSQIDARVTETFGGIRVVRAFRRERKEQRNYAVAHHTIIRKNLLAERLRLVVSAGWGLVIPAISLAIVAFGAYLVLRGQGTVGDIVAFQMFAFMLLVPVSQIVYSLSATQQALASMERVFEILERPQEKPDAPGAVDVSVPIRELRFEGVCFEYRKDLPVLKDISLAVAPGSTVALVGPSGGGKTTFVDLVARFHDPTFGAILLNGTDLRDIRLASYRRLLAIVAQEVFLFDGTVAENIAYGRRSAGTCRSESLRDIIDAAKRANAHGFIEQLPEGYDTLIGERGVKLSGGQRQCISIARAILADPEILILDEATSSLDTESEQRIQASLAELIRQRRSDSCRRTRTTFVIAHRLSTVTHADMIVVLKDGRIEQLGSHADLISQDGLYRDMVERQSAFGGPDRSGGLFTEPTTALEWD